jgi:cupin fold WbuC family metalloprotein
MGELSAPNTLSKLGLRSINAEVFVADQTIVKLDRSHVEFLRREAESNQRKRARICAHRSNDDTLHEMLIVIKAASYIHPHKHIQKAESFHIVEGRVDVVIFDDAGAITEVVELGEPRSGLSFFYRLSDSFFHTLVIRSPELIIHEVTNGPFVRTDTVLASFAPLESDTAATVRYMRELEASATQFRRASTVTSEQGV